VGLRQRQLVPGRQREDYSVSVFSMVFVQRFPICLILLVVLFYFLYFFINPLMFICLILLVFLFSIFFINPTYS
jgi:hypothetical protein